MYLEFFLLIADYFRVLKKKVFYYEFGLPFLTAFLFYLCVSENTIDKISDELVSDYISLLGILIGFSMTVITIFSSGGARIDGIYSHKTEHKIGGQQITLYRLLLINLSYSIIIEIFTLVVNLCYPIVKEPYCFFRPGKIFHSFNIFFILHVLLITIRNISDLYLVLKKSTEPKPLVNGKDPNQESDEKQNDS